MEVRCPFESKAGHPDSLYLQHPTTPIVSLQCLKRPPLGPVGADETGYGKGVGRSGRRRVAWLAVGREMVDVAGGSSHVGGPLPPVRCANQAAPSSSPRPDPAFRYPAPPGRCAQPGRCGRRQWWPPRRRRCPSQRSIMAADRMAATGLAIPLPAMSGAVPCDGWKMAASSPMSPEGDMPIPPTRPAARSERMSPSMEANRASTFSRRITKQVDVAGL